MKVGGKMNITYRTLASAKAARVVNLCLQNGYDISTVKADKLMVLFKCIMLGRYNKAPFRENIEYRNGHLQVRGVEKDLIAGATGFKEKIWEIIPLLEQEEKVLEEMVADYGQLNAFEIEQIAGLQKIAQYCEKKKIIRVPETLIRYVFGEKTSENEL